MDCWGVERWASPAYFDCRKLVFYPRIRGQLVDFAAATLARDVGFEHFGVVAVERFLHAPAQWSAAHGGVSAFPSS